MQLKSQHSQDCWHTSNGKVFTIALRISMNKTVRSNKIKEAENHLYTPVFSFIPRYLICSSVWEVFRFQFECIHRLTCPIQLWHAYRRFTPYFASLWNWKITSKEKQKLFLRTYCRLIFFMVASIIFNKICKECDFLLTCDFPWWVWHQTGQRPPSNCNLKKPFLHIHRVKISL